MIRLLATTIAFAAAMSAPWLPAQAGMAEVAMGGRFSVPVVSYQERPFLTVVRQQFDYSCGSAALATLLRHHYGRPTTEGEVFRAMYEAGDKERIHESGFSLLDMKLYLESLGYRADGFRISLEGLHEVGLPAIALIELDGYRHFVVIKGIRGDGVLVGDPAKGIRRYDRAAFEAVRVDDVVFVLRDEVDLAKANFNKDEDWRLKTTSAPVAQAVDRSVLAQHHVLARIPVQFRVTVSKPLR